MAMRSPDRRPADGGADHCRYAQGGMSVVRVRFGSMGKPYPDVEIIAKDIETGKSSASRRSERPLLDRGMAGNVQH